MVLKNLYELSTLNNIKAAPLLTFNVFYDLIYTMINYVKRQPTVTAILLITYVVTYHLRYSKFMCV